MYFSQGKKWTLGISNVYYVASTVQFFDVIKKILKDFFCF